jgi:hypothetical protein
MAERLEDRGVWVPPWAWTNLLAHGEEQDLRAQTSSRWTELHAINERWRRARAYLATELLVLTPSHGPLVVLQERILRPLELDLAASPESARWGPPEWVVHVSSVLDAHRAHERRTFRHNDRHQG